MSEEVIAGRYELLELVGRGGMSSVWKAQDRLLDRTVAIKVLHEQFTQDEEYVERFRREARSVAQLSHPNIVTVIDRGEDGGRQYIVFEYVAGRNLKQLIERQGPLPIHDALVLALQMARALGFAHNRGLIHRDVKPQNVLLNDDGQAKMTDFGIARAVDVDGVTITGTVLGTSEYIAPEQARGQRVDALTDVYSLGVVLYELLTGGVPFQGENFVAVALRHVNEPPPDVLEHRPDCPPRIALAIERAMAKRPEDRFQSMDEFVSELESCLADLDPSSEEATMISRRPVRPSRPARPPRRRRRIGLLWPIAAVLAILAVAGFAAWGALVLRDGNGGSPAAANTPIRLSGIGAFDPAPPGDNAEHDDEAPNATDGNPGTYWTTETYNDFSNSKPGVGLVLDAGKEVEPKSITVTTDTPGFTAQIRDGSSPQGPFAPVSGSQTVQGETTFDLEDAKARYFVVWITDLDSRAHVNEVTAA
ncbi:MAG TPA: protein kinase [Gaiellaceae bacterium]|nr:protein kinase [Gaiellaceae bacterium]